jgi:peptidoglycan hydrolase CwlO-like protein
LQDLSSRRTKQSNKVFEEKTELNKLQGELSKLQEDTDKEASKQAAKGSWRDT